MSDDVREKVRAIIAEQAMVEVGQVTPDVALESLGLDSLGLVETVFAIEETFEISVPYNANEPDAAGFDISTVGAVEDGVIALLKDQA